MSMPWKWSSVLVKLSSIVYFLSGYHFVEVPIEGKPQFTVIVEADRYGVVVENDGWPVVVPSDRYAVSVASDGYQVYVKNNMYQVYVRSTQG